MFCRIVKLLQSQNSTTKFLLVYCGLFWVWLANDHLPNSVLTSLSTSTSLSSSLSIVSIFYPIKAQNSFSKYKNRKLEALQKFSPRKTTNQNKNYFSLMASRAINHVYVVICQKIWQLHNWFDNLTGVDRIRFCPCLSCLIEPLPVFPCVIYVWQWHWQAFNSEAGELGLGRFKTFSV